MKKGFIRSKKARYGGMTVLLTVLLITAVVLFNVLFTTLAERYTWYADMRGEADFSVTDRCYTLLDAVLGQNDADVRILFCDTPVNLQEEVTSRYVYDTASEIAGRFPDRIRIECHNIWLNPDSVRQYTSTLNPETGEQMDVALKSTSVIIVSGDYYRVYDLTEFYVFENGDTSQLWAYNGEKKLAAGILHAVEPDQPAVCLTNNHGEAFYDYELLYLLDDAGYRIHYVDLLKDPIPEDCNLIVCFNPNQDLTVSDGVSATSETDILEDFLSESGNTFLVFLSNGTPQMSNLEGFLASWGVETCYYTNSSGNTFRYMVQDNSQSLTSDGYTIFGQAAATGHGAELVGGLTRGTVFKNATALRYANGYTNNGDGSYTSGSRTMYTLFAGGPGAVSWANGNPVDNAEAGLMTLTEQTNADGAASYVAVCASTDFATEDFLQSAVYGNTDTLLHLFGQLGKENVPEGLTIQPFESTDISTITTAQMLRWTLTLAIVPAVAVTLAGIVVLIRRRRT